MGLGFSLTQVDDAGNEYFVMCGSCSCTPAMLNYSCLELELQAMVFSVRKCSTFLMALDSFIIFTDHRDLEGLESRELVPTPNSRVLRNTEFLLSFPLQVKYLPKESNLLADWLSRNPLPAPASGLLPRFEGTVALVYEGMPLDKLLLDLIEECNRDEEYSAVLQVINEGGDIKQLRNEHPAKEYKSIWDRVSAFNGPNGQCLVTEGRIIVPKGLRAHYVDELHSHHPSADSSWLEARSKVFWPGLRGQLRDKYEACRTCQEISRLH